MDLLHRFRETLQQLDNIDPFFLQGLLDLIVKSARDKKRRIPERGDYLGYMCTCCTLNSLMMFLNGAKPLVMCSGWSEKAFTKATSFFSRNKRTMKASCDKADTLISLSQITNCRMVN